MLPSDFRQALVDCGKLGVSDSNSHALPQDTTPEPAEAPISFTLTTLDGCLVAYQWQDWQELEAKFMRITNPSAAVRDFRRMVLGGAEIHTLDAQGRIRLSQDHRDYAQLDKDVALIGLINRFEIWNPALFKQKMAAQNLNDVSSELASSGIDFSL